MNDDLDRMFRQLVRAIRANHPEYLTRPFEVGELYQNILPYRLFRRELGLDTNQDYELTLTELLSGARGYLLVDDRMADALRRELASPNPEPGVFRQFASAPVSIGAEALARIDATEGAAAPPRGEAPRQAPAASAGGGTVAPAAASVAGAAPAPPEARGANPAVPPGAEPGSALGRTPVVAGPGDGCRFCGGGLPAGRPIVFCPHCGQDQTVLHCEACGTELEVGWKYCTTCGRGVAYA